MSKFLPALSALLVVLLVVPFVPIANAVDSMRIKSLCESNSEKDQMMCAWFFLGAIEASQKTAELNEKVNPSSKGCLDLLYERADHQILLKTTISMFVGLMNPKGGKASVFLNQPISEAIFGTLMGICVAEQNGLKVLK